MRAAPALEACSYPTITVWTGRTRDIAQSAMQAYEADLQDTPEHAACVQAFRGFLSAMAYAQQRARAD